MGYSHRGIRQTCAVLNCFFKKAAFTQSFLSIGTQRNLKFGWHTEDTAYTLVSPDCIITGSRCMDYFILSWSNSAATKAIPNWAIDWSGRTIHARAIISYSKNVPVARPRTSACRKCVQPSGAAAAATATVANGDVTARREIKLSSVSVCVCHWWCLARGHHNHVDNHRSDR